jgi:hypothetical protein
MPVQLLAEQEGIELPFHEHQRAIHADRFGTVEEPRAVLVNLPILRPPAITLAQFDENQFLALEPRDDDGLNPPVVREPRQARADHGYARRQVKPGCTGPDEAARDQPSIDHPGTRPGGVRPVPEAGEWCGSNRVGLRAGIVVYILDMIGVGLIDATWPARLPAPLGAHNPNG